MADSPEPAPSSVRWLEPSMTTITVLAFVVVLVPGFVAYGLFRALGVEVGPAGLLGLLVMLVCTALYPALLRRLGWVGRR